MVSKLPMSSFMWRTGLCPLLSSSSPPPYLTCIKARPRKHISHHRLTDGRTNDKNKNGFDSTVQTGRPFIGLIYYWNQAWTGSHITIENPAGFLSLLRAFNTRSSSGRHSRSIKESGSYFPCSCCCWWWWWRRRRQRQRWQKRRDRLKQCQWQQHQQQEEQRLVETGSTWFLGLLWHFIKQHKHLKHWHGHQLAKSYGPNWIVSQPSSLN